MDAQDRIHFDCQQKELDLVKEAKLDSDRNELKRKYLETRYANKWASNKKHNEESQKVEKESRKLEDEIKRKLALLHDAKQQRIKDESK